MPEDPVNPLCEPTILAKESFLLNHDHRFNRGWRWCIRDITRWSSPHPSTICCRRQPSRRLGTRTRFQRLQYDIRCQRKYQKRCASHNRQLVIARNDSHDLRFGGSSNQHSTSDRRSESNQRYVEPPEPDSASLFWKRFPGAHSPGAPLSTTHFADARWSTLNQHSTL